MTQRNHTSARRGLVPALAFLLLAVAFLVHRTISYRSGSLATLPQEKEELVPAVFEYAALGTYIRLTFWAPEITSRSAAAEISEWIQQFHNTINLFDPDSELSRLNSTADSEPFECSESLWELLRVCRRAYHETGGAFDVSIGPLMKLWGFHSDRSSLPTEEEIANARELVGLDRVEFGDTNRTVRFTRPGMYLDMGGIAKGYAIDAAVRIVRKHKIRRVLMDFGGNIYCGPDPPPQKNSYSIGIRDPFNRKSIVGAIKILDCTVSTSGNYESYLEIENKTVHHIIDPDTGRPVPKVAAVTVVTPSGVDSDIFSTAIFVGGDKLITSLRRSRKRTGVLWIGLNSKGKTVMRQHGRIWETLDRLKAMHP